MTDNLTTLTIKDHFSTTSTIGSHICIGRITITQNDDDDDVHHPGNAEIPKLIPSISLDFPLINIPNSIKNLSKGIFTDKDVSWQTGIGYKEFYRRKHIHFMRWVFGSAYFQNVLINKCKTPTIICFGGRIKEILLTPYANNESYNWNMYAIKVRENAILLYREWDLMPCTSPATSKYGFNFELALTQHEKCQIVSHNYLSTLTFCINEIKFGNLGKKKLIQKKSTDLEEFKFLCLSQIDALYQKDGKNITVELKTLRKDVKLNTTKLLNQKYLSFWAQCKVAGIENVVIGVHENGVLTEIYSKKTNKLSDNVGATSCNWKPRVCYSFLERTLKWIDENLPHSNPNNIIVKRIAFEVKQQDIIMEDVDFNDAVRESIFGDLDLLDIIGP